MIFIGPNLLPLYGELSVLNVVDSLAFVRWLSRAGTEKKIPRRSPTEKGVQNDLQTSSLQFICGHKIK